jgi:predicted ATPase
MLSPRAANAVGRAKVECLRIDLYTTLDQMDRAVSACLGYLQNLGVEWSSRPTQGEARREYERIWTKLGGRTIEELIDLPLMSDPVSLATLDVLTRVFPSALSTDANLLSLAVCRAINLSLERGHGDSSCVAYVFFGKIAGQQFGDYKAGFDSVSSDTNWSGNVACSDSRLGPISGLHNLPSYGSSQSGPVVTFFGGRSKRRPKSAI